MQIFPENKAPRDWSIWISPEIHMDQWLPKLSESSGLNRHRPIECSSLRQDVVATIDLGFSLLSGGGGRYLLRSLARASDATTPKFCEKVSFLVIFNPKRLFSSSGYSK